MRINTFQIISAIQAQQLFDAKHPVYVTYNGTVTPRRMHYGPDEFRYCNPTFYITTKLHNNKLMNKRTAQQAYSEALPSIHTWINHKKIQYATIPNHVPEWKDYLSDVMPPDFSNEQLIWRPKPEPEKVPFNQQTIPADAWFRMKDSPACMWRIHTLAIDGCYIGAGPTRFTFKQLSSDFEHSTDRINWLPCYILKS